MKKLLIFCAFATAAYGQGAAWTASASGSSLAAGEVNGKPNYQYAAGPPSSLNCTVGKDIYINTTTLDQYVCSVTGTPGTWVKALAVFVASGAGHATGIVPDPGSTAGTTHYLREDGSWAIPPGGSSTGCVPGGSAGDMLTDSGAGACNSSVDYVLTSHTLAVGANGIFDMHSEGTAAFKVPGGLATGVLHVTTSTGATAGGLIVNADITNATIDLTAKVTGLLPQANISPVTLPTPAATCTFSNGSTVCVCTTTCTVTVPVPAAGDQFCVMNDDNVATVITMSAIGSSARYENTARTAYGTAGTGTFVSGGAVGDFVCMIGRDSTHYLTTASKGTWTAN